MSSQVNPMSHRSSVSSSSSRSDSDASTSAESTQTSTPRKSWIQSIFGTGNDDKTKDQRVERERVEMWRIMSMGYENIGQYVDVGEWVGR